MRTLAVLALFALGHGAAAQAPQQTGLLVMAHGGDAAWNQAVLEAVSPLRDTIPTSVAFGMADPVTLQAAVDSLEAQGIGRIAVVRLFMSPESFRHATEYAFGLRRDAPKEAAHGNSHQQLRLAVPVSIGEQGLLDATGLGGILVDRARLLSQDAANETVILLGHGPADDSENEMWIRRMEEMADQIRKAVPFNRVVVNTLREDWTGKRKVVEEALRALAASESAAGRTVIVIPFRLHGFGPYAEVFEGLEYRADSLGFLPDSANRITDWIQEQYEGLFQAGSNN